MTSQVIEVENFLSFTIGIVVYFAGRYLNERISILREYNIPEPVTGGIIASLVALVLFGVAGMELKFNLFVRDILLVYFFTTIGLNARLSDLVSGGRPLVILLVLTLGYIVVQNIVGIGTAAALGLPKAAGVLTGSASLIGGHGTSIAWAPEFAAKHGISNALEIGIASATLGLVIASLLGGPIAKYLLNRYKLTSTSTEVPVVGLPHKTQAGDQINHVSLMQVILAVHVAMIFGYIINEAVSAAGLKLPLFVSCLLAAIAMSNFVVAVLPNVPWPARTKSLALLSDFSLSLFIAMSLMGMQLWSIADLAGPLLVLLLLQTIAAAAFTILVLFPIMGSNYLAAVLSAGFAGFSLGATPTAIANMTAVTKTHGPAPTAFIILPLVGAFFVDITNAFVIQFFLGL
jgi:glutamate:Na+ symporter, ESS family